MYTITYHVKVVENDVPKLSGTIKKRIRTAIEEKLGSNPLLYGKFLTGGLFPFRSLRVGEYRIIFSMESATQVYVILIGHRSVVYKFVSRRLK